MYKECRHIKTNGQRCHGPALRGKPYCFFHMNQRSMHSPNLAESQRFQLPPIEDNASILLAVGQVIQTLKSPYADTKRAGLILYALQIAAQLTARQETARPEDCVRNLYDPAGEDLDFSTAVENGTQMLAPEKTICEPPTDCRTCPKQNTCNNYEEPDEEDEDYEDNAPDDDEEGEEEDEEREEEEAEEEEEPEEDNEEDEYIAQALAILNQPLKPRRAVLNQPTTPCHSDRP